MDGAYGFVIELVKMVLNYGPLGLAFLALTLIWYILKNYDLTRVKRKK